MKVNKSTPPTTVDRDLNLDFTREETLAILANYIKARMGQNYRFDDIAVMGDTNGKLLAVKVLGVETLPLSWKADESAAEVKTVDAKPLETKVPPKMAPTVAPAIPPATPAK